MKKVLTLIATVVVLNWLALSSGAAQDSVEPKTEGAGKSKFVFSLGAQAINLVGSNTDDSKFGPFFRAKFGYAVVPELTVFIESGYGWTGSDLNENLKVTQIPIVAGAVYDFGELIKSSIVRPYLGAGAGIYIARLELDGNLVSIAGTEQKTSSFGVQGLLGVNFRLPNSHVGIDVNAKFDHIFSDKDNPGLESQEWSNVGFGAGVSYYFGQ